jgi:hypothetical protein
MVAHTAEMEPTPSDRPPPLTFADLRLVAPDIADAIAGRFIAAGLAMLGTVRADGSPRVSPVEVTIQDGHLHLGSMPGAQKAKDLARDARCCLVTALADKDDLAGEGKLFCVARLIDDAEEAHRVLAGALPPGTDVSAFAGSPVYELLVTGAAWQHVAGDTWHTSSWSERTGLRRRARTGPAGHPVDVPV